MKKRMKTEEERNSITLLINQRQLIKDRKDEKLMWLMTVRRYNERRKTASRTKKLRWTM